MLPEFADGYAAQYYVGHGAEFGDEVKGFTVDGSCDWLYAKEVVDTGRDVSRSVGLFHRVNEQDFEACERCRPAMASCAYAQGGVLVPPEHHIADSTPGWSGNWNQPTRGSTGHPCTRKLARVIEQTDFLLPEGEHEYLRRIRLLAERAERTAHDRSNLVGPPPSQEHLDILAEIKKLTDEMTATVSRNARRAETLPRPARPADDLVPGKM